MNQADLSDAIDRISRGFEREDLAPLLERVDDDVNWINDWKGEGIFGGGRLFGRHYCQGRDQLAAFFKTMYEELSIQRFEPTDIVADDEEAIVMGRFNWQPRANGAAHASDFTLRLGIKAGKIRSSRFMTLPENHISTFISDDQSWALYRSPQAVKDLVNKFQKLYFDAYLFGKTWAETYWMGYPIFKCPLDLWVYQEMIVSVRPDVIVETGTNYGGSALYFAHMCDLVGHGEVVTVDIADHYGAGDRPVHERIHYLVGSSTDPAIFAKIKEKIGGRTNLLVILDSDHHAPHVLDELRLYQELVPMGGYMVVEDTNLNGNPVKQNFGPGPGEAIETFLQEGAPFEVDREKEKFYMTSNPGGFLKRIGR